MTKTKPHSPSNQLDVRLAATRLLQWLDQGATPKVADVELVAKSYLSLSRPQAGTLTEDERGIVDAERREITLCNAARDADLRGEKYSPYDAALPAESIRSSLLAIIDRLTTPPATEEDA